MAHDREHFESYRAQTQLKHAILEAYLPAYFRLVGKYENNLLYIDAFAGSGAYTGEDGAEHDGSPIRALRLVANNADFRTKVSCIFLEPDSVRFARLEKAVATFTAANQQLRNVIVHHGTFAESVAELLDAVPSLAPTFLFVDPCGVAGAEMSTILRLLENKKCEAFVFFNIDGLKRVCGADDRELLTAFFGSEAIADKVLAAFANEASAKEPEQLLLGAYVSALRDAGMEYVTTFPVEYAHMRKTSHYFVHATKHHLGFTIMKDVMHKRGAADDGPGGMTFLQRSQSEQALLVSDWQDLKNTLIKRMGDERLSVGTVCSEWPKEPDNPVSGFLYKEALKELEQERRVQVTDNTRAVCPAEDRKRPKGKTTLADRFFVQATPGR